MKVPLLLVVIVFFVIVFIIYSIYKTYKQSRFIRAEREREIAIEQARIKAQNEYRLRLSRILNNAEEMTVPAYLNLRRNHPKDIDIPGVYVLHNHTKNMYYVGQSGSLKNRVFKHFTGGGNGDVYADYKYGNTFTIQLIPITSSGYTDLNKLEKDMITRFNAYDGGYNKNRGNSTADYRTFTPEINNAQRNASISDQAPPPVITPAEVVFPAYDYDDESRKRPAVLPLLIFAIVICVGFVAIFYSTSSRMPSNQPIHTEYPTPKSTAYKAVTTVLETARLEPTVHTTERIRSAVDTANNYLTYAPYSYSALMDKLLSDQFAIDEAMLALDQCGASWDENARKAAENYLAEQSCSRKELNNMLLADQYTPDEAAYAISHCNADWKANAVESVKKYQNSPDFTYIGLLERLLEEQYTFDEAVYAVNVDSN